MSVHLSYAVPPYEINFSSPPTHVSFRLDNHTNTLLQLTVFDYEQWAATQDADEEQPLFCIDASENDTRSPQGNLPLTANNLYLVRAYFDDGENIDLVIQKSENSAAIRLQIVTVMGTPVFEHNDTYQDLSFEEAERLLNG